MITKEKVKEFVEANPKLVTRKEISVPGVYLLKYKKNVFWDNLWNDVLIECRGTLVDEDYNVVARPFTKIFNHHENGVTINRDEICMAYRKINGFMATISFYKDQLIVSTTGTDDSEFAKLAKEMILSRATEHHLKDFLNNGEATAIVEIVHNSDPHIIVEDEGVYMLGVRTNKWDAPENNINFVYDYSNWAERWKFTLGFKFPEFFIDRFSNICEAARTCKHEGFVVYGIDSGTSLKIKSPYYLMSKFLARKNEAKMLKLIDNPDEIKKIVDEEYYHLVDFICEHKDVYVNANEQERLNIIRNYLNGDADV